MSQVFARKYRPQTFSDVVGQETTVRILKNALSEKRLHHAYLFSGPRGIGKTTLARLFAKALNCEKGPTPDFCDPKSANLCAACRDIMEAKSLSVIEIDGASNTSVEDVRDLREKIRYLPPGGRYKIYIIDEVHMLSTAAFNALLKTLEEPPPHALLLFATTEAQKIPATVLSRLIRFDLRSISRSQIVEQLTKVTREENVPSEERALFEIAREAEGGLRDALSLLDQIVAFSGGQVTLQAVEEILGVSTQRFVTKIAQAILAQESAAALKVGNEALNAGVDSKRLGFDLLEYFRHLLIAQATQGVDDPALFDHSLSPDEIRDLRALSSKTSLMHLDRIFRILQKGISEIVRSPIPKILWDVLILRLSQHERLVPIDEFLGKVAPSSPIQKTAPLKTPPPTITAPVVETPPKGWKDFLNHVERSKPQMYSILLPGVLASFTSDEIVLQFAPKSFQATFLRDPERSVVVTGLLQDFFKRPIAFRVQDTPLSSASTSSTSQVMNDMMDVFGPNTREVNS